MLLTIYYVIIKKTVSPLKSEEDVMIKFCQKQSFADVLQNRCPSKLRKFHRRKPVLGSLLNKVVGPKVCNFIKKRPQHRCFPVKCLKFLRAPFLTEHLWWLLLEGVCKRTSLVKISQSCHYNIFGINHRCFRKIAIKKNIA